MGQMSQGLIRRLTVQSQYEEALVKINATAAERLAALKSKPQATIQRDMLSICSDPFTVAQQLTHIELVRTRLKPTSHRQAAPVTRPFTVLSSGINPRYDKGLI